MHEVWRTTRGCSGHVQMHADHARTLAHAFMLHRNHLLPVHMSPAGKIVQPTPGPFSTNRPLDCTSFYFCPRFSRQDEPAETVAQSGTPLRNDYCQNPSGSPRTYQLIFDPKETRTGQLLSTRAVKSIMVILIERFFWKWKYGETVVPMVHYGGTDWIDGILNNW